MIGINHSEMPICLPTALSGGQSLPEVLILSSSLLTDRMLVYTKFLKAISRCFSVKVWATSVRDPRFQAIWNASGANVEAFPEIHPFKEVPHNYLRRLNEFVWDFSKRPSSRLSMMRFVLNKHQKGSVRALRLPARMLALLNTENVLESWLEKILLAYPRSPEALGRLRSNAPTVLVTTGPQRYEEPAVVSVAKNLGIKTLAFITSWDNLSTKGRIVFKHDGYLLWSEQMREELHYLYPHTRNVPTYIVGAPQFDVFFQEEFQQTREAFCASQGLCPELPIIVYALGSPNFLREHHGALFLAERVTRGELGDVQLVIRPHPIHDNGNETRLFSKFGSRVTVQRTGEAKRAVTARFQDRQQITEWVNTFRHADVVVNLSSTVAIDAAIFDRPVVNLDFDPEPGQPNQALIKDINHCWIHFKPIAESGGLWLVNNFVEMVEAVKAYLAQPELHREQRRWIAEYVCGYLDGRCGERLAQSVLDFVHRHTGQRAQYDN
jgi:hypothetical protein